MHIFYSVLIYLTELELAHVRSLPHPDTTRLSALTSDLSSYNLSLFKLRSISWTLIHLLSLEQFSVSSSHFSSVSDMFISNQYFSRDHHEINPVFRVHSLRRAPTIFHVRAFYNLWKVYHHVRCTLWNTLDHQHPCWRSCYLPGRGISSSPNGHLQPAVQPLISPKASKSTTEPTKHPSFGVQSILLQSQEQLLRSRTPCTTRVRPVFLLSYNCLRYASALAMKPPISLKDYHL